MVGERPAGIPGKSWAEVGQFGGVSRGVEHRDLGSNQSLKAPGGRGCAKSGSGADSGGIGAVAYAPEVRRARHQFGECGLGNGDDHRLQAGGKALVQGDLHLVAVNPRNAGGFPIQQDGQRHAALAVGGGSQQDGISGAGEILVGQGAA